MTRLELMVLACEGLDDEALAELANDNYTFQDALDDLDELLYDELEFAPLQ